MIDIHSVVEGCQLLHAKQAVFEVLSVIILFRSQKRNSELLVPTKKGLKLGAAAYQLGYASSRMITEVKKC